MLLVLGIILLLSLVVLHELGHFIAARRSGVVVEEFGIGFPPRLWKKKMPSGFLLSFNLLPLGGFVRLKGEHDASKLPGSFGATSLINKIKIMLAGIGMNILVAFILITIVALVGLPKLIDNQFALKTDNKIIQQVEGQGVVLVDRVVENSPAVAAGIMAEDQIVNINGEAINSVAKVGEITKAHAGETVQITVKRNDQLITTQAKINEQAQNGYLGVAAVSGEHGIEASRHTWSAPIVALGLIKQFTELTFKGLGTVLVNLFQGNAQQASEQVAGPVGVFVLLKESTALGLSFLLMIIAIISLTLALMNVLPIPALDGGRLFVLLLFRALRKPLTREREEIIHATGFIVLMALLILITAIDVKRIF